LVRERRQLLILRLSSDLLRHDGGDKLLAAISSPANQRAARAVVIGLWVERLIRYLIAAQPAFLNPCFVGSRDAWFLVAFA